MPDTFIALMRRIANLCRKEFLAVLKDPKTRFILVMPALVQSLLFGYAATYDLSNVPYAVLDRSHSAASAELLARLDGPGVFHRVANADTEDEVRALVDAQKA